MCGHFIMVDRMEVERIAKEIELDLAAHEGELTTLDPLASSDAGRREDGSDHPQQTESPALQARGGALHAGSDAFPTSIVSVIAFAGDARLTVVDMAWGFDVSWRKGPVFNTRLETALGDPSSMWAEPFARRRCIVPAWAFFESHAIETVPSLRTGRPIKRPYIFTRPDSKPLLLAAVHDHGRFSLMTTEPNAAVAAVHNRMPLVLDDGREAARWLAGRCEPLADRTGIALEVASER